MRILRPKTGLPAVWVDSFTAAATPARMPPPPQQTTTTSTSGQSAMISKPQLQKGHGYDRIHLWYRKHFPVILVTIRRLCKNSFILSFPYHSLLSIKQGTIIKRRPITSPLCWYWEGNYNEWKKFNNAVQFGTNQYKSLNQGMLQARSTSHPYLAWPEMIFGQSKGCKKYIPPARCKSTVDRISEFGFRSTWAP